MRYRWLWLWMGLALVGCATREAEWTMTLIHTNDLHAHILPFNDYEDCVPDAPACLGGFARLDTFLKEQRHLSPEAVILDAGDRFTGSAFYTLAKSQPLLPLFQSLPYDAVTLGNHEFDDNLSETVKFFTAWPVPVVVANLDMAPAEPLAALVQPVLIPLAPL